MPSHGTQLLHDLACHLQYKREGCFESASANCVVPAAAQWFTQRPGPEPANIVFLKINLRYHRLMRLLSETEAVEPALTRLLSRHRCFSRG